MEQVRGMLCPTPLIARDSQTYDCLPVQRILVRVSRSIYARCWSRGGCAFDLCRRVSPRRTCESTHAPLRQFHHPLSLSCRRALSNIHFYKPVHNDDSVVTECALYVCTWWAIKRAAIIFTLTLENVDEFW